jgi:hypothetical protein
MFINFFLRASALQLCVLMVLPYLTYKITNFGASPYELGLLFAYFMVVYFGWLYSVGVSANRQLDPQLQISPMFIGVAAIVPFLYLPIFVFLYMVPLYQGQLQRPPQMMIVLHFISIFAGAYCIWYSAKQFTAVRMKSDTSFIDYYPAFMGFWFGFVGVWFLQPKIVELLGSGSRERQQD